MFIKEKEKQKAEIEKEKAKNIIAASDAEILLKEKSDLETALEKKKEEYNALDEVIDSNVSELRSVRGELDARAEEIRLLEENKGYLMDENSTLKNKLKVVSPADKHTALSTSFDGSEAYGDIVNTISALTDAMDLTVKKYESIHEEFEQFKQHQKLMSLQLGYLNCLNRQHTQYPSDQQLQSQGASTPMSLSRGLPPISLTRV